MVVTAGLLAGINGSVARLLVKSGFSYVQLTLLRSIAAFVVLLVICLFTDIRRLLVAKQAVPRLMVFGLVGFFGVPILYLLAITHLPVGIAVTVEYTAPVFVALWIKFVKRQTVRRHLWLGLALCIGGLSIVANIWMHLHLNYFGIGYALGAALLLAAFYLIGSHESVQYDTISLSCWSFGVAALGSMLIQPIWNFPFRVLGNVSHGIPNWLLCIYVVLLGSVIPYLLLTTSLRYLPAITVAVLSLAEPITATVVAWLFLKERLSGYQIAGILLILSGIVVSEMSGVLDAETLRHSK